MLRNAGLAAQRAARSGSSAAPGACHSCRFLAVPAARAHPRPLVAESRERLRFCGGGVRSSWSEKLGLTTTEHVAVSFTGGNDVTVTVQAKVGDSILQIARAHEVELEAVCEGQLACATCHTIFEKTLYDTLTPPKEDELDMLDSAEQLSDTSRLGCQIRVTKAFEGARLRIIPDIATPSGGLEE